MAQFALFGARGRAVLGIATFWLIAVTACGTGGSSPPTSQRIAADGGTFVVGGAGWDCLDPALCHGNQITNAYATLVALDASGQVIPYLAKSIKTSLTQIVFTMRDDVTCSDGTKLTPTMVKNSLQRVIDKGVGNAVRWGQGPYSVFADDSSGTVTFNTQTAYHDLIYGFAEPYPGSQTAIVCPAGLANPSQMETKSFGAGPYVITEAVSGDHLTFKLRPEFKWGPQGVTASTPGIPKTVVYRVVNNMTTTANLLVTGGLNLAVVNGPDVGRLLGDKTLTHYVSYKHTATPLFINQAAGRPGADIAVRQALMTVIDTKAYNQAATNGRGKQVTSEFPTGDPCYDPKTAAMVPKPSQDKAKSVLTAAGYSFVNGKFTKNGKPLTMNLIGDGTEGAGPEYIVNAWNQLGVTSQLVVNDQATFVNRVVVKADYDATVFTLNTPLPLPGAQLFARVSGAPFPKGSNYAGVPDQILTDESTAAESTTGAESCKHWANFQEELWKQWTVLPLINEGYDFFAAGYDVSPSRLWLGATPAAWGARKLT